MRKRALPIVHYRFDGPDQAKHSASGREGETLLLLDKHGKAGVTAFAFPGGPAFRLSAYIKNLRDMGLDIETFREPHDCGWHGRYVLLDTVCTLIDTQENQPNVAAT